MASYALASQLSGQSDTSGSTSFDFQAQWGWCPTDSSGSRFSVSHQSDELRPSSSSASASPSYLHGLKSASVATANGDESLLPRCVATLQGPHGGNVVSLALSGDLLYSGSDSSDIRMWRHTSSQAAELISVGTRFRLRGDGGAVKALVVVKDRLYSAHQDRKLRVWSRPISIEFPVTRTEEQPDNTNKHKLVATLPTIQDYVVSCLPPNNYVRVRRHHKALWIQHADTISVLVAGAGVLYSGSWDKSIKVWRLSDHKCLESLAAHDDAVNALVVDQSNAFLYSGGADAKIKVWARILPDGSSIPTTPLTTPIATSRQGLLPSKASAANLLSPQAGLSVRYQPRKSSSSYMSSPAAADPTLLHNRNSYSRKHHHHFKGTSPLHPHASNQHGSHLLVATLEGHGSAINALALSPEGGLLYSASGDCTISVWEREDSARHMTFATVLRGHQQAVLCLSVSQELQEHNYVLCSGSADSSIRVWRRTSAASLRHVCLVVLQGHQGPVRSLALRDSSASSAGLFLYSGGMDHDIKIWWLPFSNSCHHSFQLVQQKLPLATP